MDSTNNVSDTGCCKKFDPSLWDAKETTFENKLFLKDRVASFFHMPLNFGQVMTRSLDKIKKAGASSAEDLVLTDENSFWGADVLIAIGKEIPGAETVKISGTFLTKVFEGPFQNMGTWIKEMETFVKSKSKETKKMYFFYTTCPKCAKVYGKNYVVIFAQVG